MNQTQLHANIKLAQSDGRTTSACWGIRIVFESNYLLHILSRYCLLNRTGMHNYGNKTNGTGFTCTASMWCSANITRVFKQLTWKRWSRLLDNRLMLWYLRVATAWSLLRCPADNLRLFSTSYETSCSCLSGVLMRELSWLSELFWSVDNWLGDVIAEAPDSEVLGLLAAIGTLTYLFCFMFCLGPCILIPPPPLQPWGPRPPPE